MKLAVVTKNARSGVFETMEQAVRPNESTSGWRGETINTVNTAQLIKERRNKQEEVQLMRQLACELIDIGYKVLATKLHPDKGGSPEAMARLNKVRTILKDAI